MVYDGSATKNMEEDQHTFLQLKAVANSLDQDIQMEIYTPSLHETGLLPVLDLGLSVKDNKIHHTFYSKPMASPYTIHFRSAISRRTKRDTLLQEGMRRLRNMGPGVTNGEKNEVMSKYMNMLRVSGYDEKYRFQMLQCIINRQKEIEREIREGVRIRFRSREQIEEQKSNRLGKHPGTWFLRGAIQNTLKVQGTPGSGLARAMQSTLGNRICAEGGATKIVELGGRQITSGLGGLQKFRADTGCVFTPR